MLPEIIKGNILQDNRGNLFYNNNFNLSQIKRMYLIENENINIKRGWQGHKIEQRWFTAVSGTFTIWLIKIDNWENPSCNLEPNTLKLSSESLDVLHVPPGFISCIQATENASKLLIMSDYVIGEITDEYKFDINYFHCF